MDITKSLTSSLTAIARACIAARLGRATCRCGSPSFAVAITLFGTHRTDRRAGSLGPLRFHASCANKRCGAVFT